MAKFFRFPFGINGDRVAIPEPTQVGGAVSYQEGFGLDYERDPVSDPLAKNIPRDETNQLYYDITDAIRQYQTHGVPDFITTADNGGVAYSYDKLAKVLYNDGSGMDIYTSLVNANNALPSDATKWRKGEGGITNLTGDVVANGPGSVTATIQNNAITTAKILAQNVTLAKIAAQANNTVLLNNSGGAASPSAFAIAAQRLLGRGQSGDIANIELSGELAFLANVLAISLAQNSAQKGYIKLPGGITLQWGLIDPFYLGGGGTFPTPTAETFAIPFSANVWAVLPVVYDTTPGSYTPTATMYSYDLNGFEVIGRTTGGTFNAKCFWLAIGK